MQWLHIRDANTTLEVRTLEANFINFKTNPSDKNKLAWEVTFV